jgi:putative MATE family efflux protein
MQENRRSKFMKSATICLPKGKFFFSRDRKFYHTFVRLALLIILQNIFTFTVNIADNLMLGTYRQAAMSGATAINQIQYIVQGVLATALGQGISMVGSQYWGKRQTDPIQTLTGTALKVGLTAGAALTVFAFAAPRTMAGIFTSDPEIIDQAVQYLSIIRYSYLFFITTSLLLAALRSVQIVGIAFKLTIMTLIVNVGINYCLIFGKFGFPEMGIRGAAIGTLTARIAEFVVLLIYMKKSQKIPFRMKLSLLFRKDRHLAGSYLRAAVPYMISQIIFCGATAMQTAIFGHLSADAIAANSIANTMMQYCKLIPVGAGVAAGVLIGEAVGKKKWDELRAYVHSLQIIFLMMGILASVIFFIISHLLIGLYQLSPGAIVYAKQMILILGIILIGIGYQVPCLTGIISGGGDSGFVMKNDMIYAGCFTIPIGLIGALVFHLGVVPLVILMNFDQIMKCLTNTLKVQSYSWIKIWADN